MSEFTVYKRDQYLIVPQVKVTEVYGQVNFSPLKNFERFVLEYGEKESKIRVRDAYLLLDSLSKRQIISSVDGLGAAVDSLKANDASVFEFQHEKVYDYKVGSLSGGKDVGVRVKASEIDQGGYLLTTYLYLEDRNTGEIQPLGGITIHRWGMPHASTNTARPWKFADLAEDVQSFIKALRVYEFKDMWVAFFAAQEYMPRAKEYIHYFRIFVIPKAMEGEEGWFEPYMIVWDVSGVKYPIEGTMEVFYPFGSKFYYVIAVGLEGGDKKRGYVHIGYADVEKKKLYYVVTQGGLDNSVKDQVKFVSLGDDQ